MKDSRRNFVKKNLVLAGGALVGPARVFKSSGMHQLKMCLNAGAIGANYDQNGLVDMAMKHGYHAVVSLPEELAMMDAAAKESLMKKMNTGQITWGSGGLATDFRKDNATFREGLQRLPAHAQALASVGATRMNTWIMPSNPDYTYRHNFELHRRRLKSVASILGHYDIRLGLEYVGPKTLLTRSKFSFIRTMAEGKELIEAIDEPNVGFVLDSFHWYCAGDKKSDLLSLRPEDIVTVDLNDARSGLTPDTQIDGKRELPMATGVIPIKEFLEALVQLGYEGPVRAEPFNQALRDMDDEDAVVATQKAMQKAFDLLK